MSEYSSVPSSGKLKLKGVKDARIDKKKKKKKTRPEDDGPSNEGDFVDKSVILKKLEDEDSKISKESSKQGSELESREEELAGDDAGKEDLRVHIKTDAEKRYEEQRRKRLEERMKREGVKTHKERVEELNKYLSNLSEHHDMPKIGPG